MTPRKPNSTRKIRRTWVIFIVGAVIGVILIANSHLVIVAFDSYPECAKTRVALDGSGNLQTLEAVKGRC
jgi:hypothetical protein